MSPRRHDRGLAALVGWSCVTLALLAPLVSRAEWLPDGNPVADVAPEQVEPHAASNGSGGAFVVWTQLFGARMQSLSSSGQYEPGWPTDGALLPPSGVLADFSRVRQAGMIADGRGGTYIVFLYGRRCGISCYREPGQLFVQRKSASGEAAPGWSARGTPIETTLVDGFIASRLAIAPDERGGAIVVWLSTTYASMPPAPRRLSVQRIGPAGDLLWGPDGRKIAFGNHLTGRPSMVADGEGGVFVLWSVRDSVTGQAGIRGQHVSASGAVLWPSSGRAVSRTAFLRLTGLAATTDGDGGVIVAWTGTSAPDSASAHVFAARLDRRGALVWRRDRPLCEAAGEQEGVQLVPSRRGSVIAAWLDRRGGDHRMVYAQRLTREGRPEWERNGVPVCVAAGDRDQLRATTDGDGGAYAAWGDTRAEGVVFATRLTTHGSTARGWDANGTRIARRPANEAGRAPIMDLDIVPLPRGRAMLAWSATVLVPAESGTMLERVFAMLLLPGGPAASLERMPPTNLPPAPGALQGSTPIGFGIEGVVPNPASAGARVRFALTAARPASLELFDLAGRRLWSREVGDLGAGRHSLRLRDGAWSPPGLYLLRLSQGTQTATARVTVLR